MKPKEDSSHLFLAGPPRGGTTLLRILLSEHPKIEISPEAKFVTELFHSATNVQGKLSPEKIKDILEILRKEKKLNQWPGFSFEELRKVITSLSGPDLSEIFHAIFMYFAEEQNKEPEYVGNKKGVYALGYGKSMKKIFPGSKYIYILRDPRDVARSTHKNLAKGWIEAAIQCQIRAWFFEEMTRLHPADTKFVKYEDLVRHTEETTKKICKFLEIEFNSDMLNFHKNTQDDTHLLNSTKDIHQNTKKPPDPSLIGQWKDNEFMDSRKVAKVESLTGDLMEKFGYQFKTSPGCFMKAKDKSLAAYKYYRHQIRWFRRVKIYSRGAQN